MPRKPFRGSHLVVPGETSRTVAGELDVIRRISVNEGVRRERQRIEIAANKNPVLQHRFVRPEIYGVSNRAMFAKGHIELAAPIEATKSIETGSIEIVEQFRRFLALRATVID